MVDVTQLCEIAMLCIFGASWPFNIAKPLRSKTAKGNSVIFELLVILGYCIGLFGKIWAYMQSGVLAYSTWFYVADIAMVVTDAVLYARNTKLDRIGDLTANIDSQKCPLWYEPCELRISVMLSPLSFV